MKTNIAHIFRSASLAIIGLPIALSTSGLIETSKQLMQQSLNDRPINIVEEQLETALVRPCIDFYVSKVDSKVEREAKNQIDEIMGGETNYTTLCEYILK